MDGYYEIREITNTWLGLDPNDDRFKAIWTEARDGQRFIATENDDLNYGHWFFFFFFGVLRLEAISPVICGLMTSRL